MQLTVRGNNEEEEGGERMLTPESESWRKGGGGEGHGWLSSQNLKSTPAA